MSGGLTDWRWLRPLERGFGSFPKPLSGVPWVGNCLVVLPPADTLLSMVTDVWGEMFTNLVDLKLCLIFTVVFNLGPFQGNSVR